jgi:hypothetical protein
MEYAFILSLLRWTMPSVFNRNDTLCDETGRPLDGDNKYTITFERGATAPWMPFRYDPDGSGSLAPTK